MKYSTASYLMHYGVNGQKWGVRRYQNPDGSLTPEGKEHYGLGSSQVEAMKADISSMYKKNGKAKGMKADSLIKTKAAYKKSKYDQIDEDTKEEYEKSILKMKSANKATMANMLSKDAAEKAKKEVDKMADEIFGSDKMLKQVNDGFNYTWSTVGIISSIALVGDLAYLYRLYRD